MPNIRISMLTHENLVEMKRGMDSLDDVIIRLITCWKMCDLTKEVKKRERKALEAKREKSSKGPGRGENEPAR